MPVVTNPINAAIAAASPARAVSGELLLQPGSVVDAQVLAAQPNLVKVAIAGIAIEILSEVPLQPGTVLKLAVSQTADSIRLAVVDKTLPDQAERISAPPPPATATNVNLATTARVIAPSIQPAQTPAQSLEPSIALQAAVVSVAARAAAPLQASMAPLFANLPVIVASAAAPLDVKAAAANLLAARPNLTEDLSAADLRAAFKSSGVLLEAGLAKGVMPARALDLKAALTIFRQILSRWAATGEGKLTVPHPSSPLDESATDTWQSLRDATATAATLRATDKGGGSSVQGQAFPADGRELARTDQAQAKIAGASMVPGGQPSAAQKLGSGEPASIPSPSFILDPPETVGTAALAWGYAVARALKDQIPDPSKPPAQPAEIDTFDVTLKPPAATPLPTARAAAEPSPPFRGSTPSAQPVAPPTITPETPASHMAARLLDQTDSALARQTLLQVASLPERFDAGNASQTQPRWAFEIPFAVPQGTAIAQFEIADEGGGLSEAGAPKRIWRARFTLDIETTGPVHALVSLAGEKTSVRIWAERPDTVSQLRDNAQVLDSAMREANLEPGDIVVQAGLPPQRAAARAGHFLDRAT